MNLKVSLKFDKVIEDDYGFE